MWCFEENVWSIIQAIKYRICYFLMLLKLFRQICLVKSSETFPGLIWLSLNAPWDPGDRRVVVPPPVAGCPIWAQLPIFSSLHLSTLSVLVIQSWFDHYNCWEQCGYLSLGLITVNYQWNGQQFDYSQWKNNPPWVVVLMTTHERGLLQQLTVDYCSLMITHEQLTVIQGLWIRK